MKSKKNVVKLMATLFLSALLFSSFTADTVENGEWTFLTEQAEVKAFVQVQKCENSSLYVFKFENQTDKALEVEVTMEAVNDPTFPPVKNSIRINPNQPQTGSCETLWKLALPNAMEPKGTLKDQVSVSIKLNQKTN